MIGSNVHAMEDITGYSRDGTNMLTSPGLINGQLIVLIDGLMTDCSNKWTDDWQQRARDGGHHRLLARRDQGAHRDGNNAAREGRPLGAARPGRRRVLVSHPAQASHLVFNPVMRDIDGSTTGLGVRRS